MLSAPTQLASCFKQPLPGAHFLRHSRSPPHPATVPVTHPPRPECTAPGGAPPLGHLAPLAPNLARTSRPPRYPGLPTQRATSTTVGTLGTLVLGAWASLSNITRTVHRGCHPQFPEGFIPRSWAWLEATQRARNQTCHTLNGNGPSPPGSPQRGTGGPPHNAFTPAPSAPPLPAGLSDFMADTPPPPPRGGIRGR